MNLNSGEHYLCYVLIWNPNKHNGRGGFDKPPVNPYTLTNGSSADPLQRATYKFAHSQIGKTARVRVKDHDGYVEAPVAGVSLCLEGTGIVGIDLDNVVRQSTNGRWATKEALEIVNLLDTKTEISVSGTGFHILAYVDSNKLPEGMRKVARGKRDNFGGNTAEYQVFTSGCLTISGNGVSGKRIEERTSQFLDVYRAYFAETQKNNEAFVLGNGAALTALSPMTSCQTGVFTFERWMQDASKLTDEELLQRIFASGNLGQKVRKLYEGDYSNYRSQSEADLALVHYLYGFTHDDKRTVGLFNESSLHREYGKARGYVQRMVDKSKQLNPSFIGHIVLTEADKKVYAKTKQAEEMAEWDSLHPNAAYSRRASIERR